jgi:hypothetical protein
VFLSRNDDDLRKEYKKQLFWHIREGGVPVDKIIKLLIFVRDFVHLPDLYEKDFMNVQISLNFSTEYTMQFTEGTKQMAIQIFEHVYGYNPEGEKAKAEEEKIQAEDKVKTLAAEIAAKMAAEIAAKMAAEMAARDQREQELEKIAEEERTKAEEARESLRHTITNLSRKLQMEAPEIATTMKISEEEVNRFLAELAAQDEKGEQD